MKISATNVIILLLGVILGFALAVFVPAFLMNPFEDSEVRVGGESVLYEDAGGRFSFYHPPGVQVNCSAELDEVHCLLTSPTNENPQPIPDMTVTIGTTGIQAHAWEGLEVSYLDELVSSLRLTR